MEDTLSKICLFEKPKKVRAKKVDQFLKQEIIIGESSVILTLPLKTVSEGNSFEHWQKKASRHKEQKRIVALFLNPIVKHIKLPCSINLKRLSPRELDVLENLPMSFKYITDAVCDCLIPGLKPGRADGDKRLTLSCSQEKSKSYGIKITFEF